MKRQILYISSIPWDYAWHRQQEMMTKMAEEGFDILFVQPCTKNPFKSTLVKQAEHIWLFSPSGLPYERVLSCIHWYNARMARRQILKVMEEIGFHSPIVWLDRVHGFDFPFFAQEAFVVYDLIDEILSFGRVRNEKMLLSLENEVLRRADLLLTSSQLLAKRKLLQADVPDKSYQFIPNGVDVLRFATVEEWERIKDIPHPRIGFVGTIGKRRFNCGLLQSLIERNPEWEFLFVGPQESNVRQELLKKNVHFFDCVPGEMIPAIINSFDVGIIPYSIDKADMDYVFPRKACEFLAAGKPVVATPLAELSAFEGHIAVADSVEDFEHCIQVALQDIDGKQERIEFVKRFDWNLLLKGLLKELNKKGGGEE